MPIYAYRCPNGHEFEVFQSMAEDPVTECQECGAPVERVFHPVAVHFKGSGFYTTDYAKSGSKSKSTDGGSGDSNSDSGSSDSDKKSDSGSKSEGSKSEGSKSESSKSEGSGDKAKATSSD